MHDLSLWGTSIDGFVCEAVSGPKGTASGILSTYFEKPVHLLFKGPRPRVIEPTSDFPNLQATAKYQDMYPLLVLSEESTDLIEKELQGYVGTQGIEERWKTDKVVIERLVYFLGMMTSERLMRLSRFRPNIVVKGGGPFAEDDWGTITIGERDETPEISLVSRCTRCLVSIYPLCAATSTFIDVASKCRSPNRRKRQGGTIQGTDEVQNWLGSNE